MNKLKAEQSNITKCILTAVVLFLFSILFGYWLALNDPQSVRVLIQEEFSQFGFVQNLNLLMVFLFIFLNNAIKGFFVMVFGVLFGISAVIFIFINGELIGLVLGVSQSKVGAEKIILGILPHGIFEVPAIILAASYGLWLGYKFYRFARFSEPFKIYFSHALRKYVLLILPLLLVAALIETFVTPLVIAHLAK